MAGIPIGEGGRVVACCLGCRAGLRSQATNSNAFRVDWLAAYQPAPGTALFFGYGSGFTEPNALTFRQLRRSADGVFVKLSYLLRS